MDFDHKQPIYIQIGTDIKEQILKGTLNLGSKLPSVREYAVLYEVSPLTIHRALQYLELEGILETRIGVGSFVRESITGQLTAHMVTEQVRNFVEKMRKCGLSDRDIQNEIAKALEGDNEDDAGKLSSTDAGS